MSYRLIVRPEAEADIHNAYQRYEGEVSGLGIQFLEVVDVASTESQKIHYTTR